MKIKSIAFGSIMVVMTATTAVAKAQVGAPMFKLVLQTGASCDLSLVQMLYMDPVGECVVMGGDSSATFLQYATAQFNPKEYSLSRNATISSVDSSSRSSHSMTVPPAESFRALLAGATSVAGSGGGRGNLRSSGQSDEPGSMNPAILNDLVPFCASDESSMVRLPPAVSGGVPVDPIGHIYCALKTRTKSNQANERTEKTRTKSNNANDRSSGHAGEKLEVTDNVSAQNVRIVLQGIDGKGEMVVTPISMGALKLTKADVGSPFDGGMTKKIRDWIKSSFDNRSTQFDPSLTNVLQFDVSSNEAERLFVRFKPDQRLRVKVKFPWLCDADCSMTEPLGKSWVDKISSTLSRISIVLNPEACRLLPTVNK